KIAPRQPDPCALFLLGIAVTRAYTCSAYHLTLNQLTHRYELETHLSTIHFRTGHGLPYGLPDPLHNRTIFLARYLYPVCSCDRTQLQRQVFCPRLYAEPVQWDLDHRSACGTLSYL